MPASAGEHAVPARIGLHGNNGGDRARARLTELTLDFLAYLELERGLSRNTLEAYRSDLQQFGQFLDRRGVDPLDVDDRRPRRVRLRARRRPRGEDRRSRRPRCSARSPACARSTGTCVASRSSTTIPTSELRPPRSPGRLPKVLTRDEVLQLLAQPRGSSPAALRDRALLETMYACGLRASEAIALQLSELDLERGILRARGKGSKERIVPIGSKAIETLRSYLDARPAEARRAPRRAAGVRQPARAAGCRARGSTRSSSATRAAPGSSTG